MKKTKILVAGGGSSSGHITPLIAVIEALKTQPTEILWVGDLSERTRLLAAEAAVPFVGIPTGKFHRYLTLENLLTPWRYLAGVRAAKKLIREFAPAVVFGKGGSVSLPVVMAAEQLAVPVVIHESDAVMGLANWISVRRAQKVCVSFPVATYPNVPQEKLVFTGIPVRQMFARVRAKTHSKPRLLVTGGGQGSRALNSVVRSALSELLPLVDVIHLTGERDFAQASQTKVAGYRPIAYARDDMAQLMADADVILTRASGTTLAEIALVGRPTILVPLPTSANDHQRANAQAWQAAGAGSVVEEHDLTPERLVSEVRALCDQPQLRAHMAKAARSLARPKAAAEIAQILIREAQRSEVV